MELTETWNRAFLAGVGEFDSLMISEDYGLARRLRDNGRTPAYAAARVRLRIRNRRAARV